MNTKEIDVLIAAALKEDMPAGDITSENLIDPKTLGRALLVAKQDGVLAGIDIARRVFHKIDPLTSFNRRFKDGQTFKAGDVLAEIEGRAVVLLKGERTALNFLQRMSGIASTTRKYVEAVAGTKARILDTRKTTPGLRVLEKYAVRMGGGENHRLNLSTMVLIKDNHLMLVGDIVEAVRRVRKRIKAGLLVEVEVTSFLQAKAALESGADWIMLDNMSLSQMKRIVASAAGRAKIEASGNVGLDTVRKIAESGVDYISVGKLTHSYDSIDLSLEFLGELPRQIDSASLKIPVRKRS
ncbi:MAG: carboxylating nicotinate-nucleotide diphosphorylase [Candidatus Aminicenantes bacterium]|nr:carboxylating nicotinate-nucleotide diphosphorylase [Candidatus Aminicenantes bacterium]